MTEDKIKTLVDSFRKLFRGYELAHGTYDVKYTNDRGKEEGVAQTKHGEPPIHAWKGHLEGDLPGIGIIPLRKDNTCYFGVIDIDSYNNFSHEDLERKINLLKLPLTVCRSKSGGAHCYMFFHEPVPAQLLRDKLDEIKAYLGYGSAEVFPKQSYRVHDHDVGNYINLCYYNYKKTLRYAFHEGKDISLPDFIKLAESRKIGIKELEKISFQDKKTKAVTLFEDGPPCLEHLEISGGFPEGTRNEGMYNVAIYLRKRYPDSWQSHIQEYNIQMCKPAVSVNELQQLMKSIERKNYDYRCTQAPIKPHCNKRKCVGCRFGVGDVNNGGGGMEFGHFTKYEGTPPYWIIEIDNQRVQFATEELYNQSAFNKRCMEVINRVPGMVSAKRWLQLLDEKVRHADIIPTPEDTTELGQLWMLLLAFSSVNHQAKRQEEMINGKPYRDAGRVYFTSRGLIEYLEKKKFNFKNVHYLWHMLRARGGEKHSIVIRGVAIQAWSIPDPGNFNAETTETMKVSTPI